VTAGYARDSDILQEVSLTLPEGQTVGVVGLNGPGKSTIVRAIYGFLHPRRANLPLGRGQLEHTAPSDAVPPGLVHPAGNQACFPTFRSRRPGARAAQAGRRGARGAAAPIEEALERFPMLRERRRAEAGNLSGGQQKMLQFALALLVRPHLCLIDEPTAGLAPKDERTVGLAPEIAGEGYDWIEAFRAEEGMTILFVDHNVRKVIERADYVYALSFGRIAAAGPRADFQSDLHGQVREWLGIRL
jgi:branched-chain amino acid transport system ATP-binding protein